MTGGRAVALSIGSLARETGAKVQTIRYYEQIGLLPEPARTAGNQRVYGKSHRDRLAFIRHARELGFPLDAIRELLSLSDDPAAPCATADHIARDQLAAVEARIRRLEALKIELERMLCDHARTGTIADCRVIEVLADHSHGHCVVHHEDPEARAELADTPAAVKTS